MLIVKRMAMAAIVAGLALPLFGCNGMDRSYSIYGATNFATAAARQSTLNYIRENNSLIKKILGPTLLYVPLEDYLFAIQDERDLFRLGMGLVLARLPDLLYREYFIDVLPNDKSRDIYYTDVTEDQFNELRRYGQDFLDKVKARPENIFRAQREELFRARAGISDEEFNQIDPDAYVALIEDDDAFEKFLTDNDFAYKTIKKAFPYNTATTQQREKGTLRDLMYDAPTLGPIYTGVTPSSGS